MVNSWRSIFNGDPDALRRGAGRGIIGGGNDAGNEGVTWLDQIGVKVGASNRRRVFTASAISAIPIVGITRNAAAIDIVVQVRG